MRFLSAFSYITNIDLVLMSIEQYQVHKDADILADNLRDALLSALGERVTRPVVRRFLRKIVERI